MSVAAAGLQALVQQMQGVAQQAGGQHNAAQQAGGVSFAGELKGAIDRIDGMKQTAETKAAAFSRGDSNVALNDVMVDMQKASVATEMGIQVRNRVLSAYREIMSMQV
ncbi:flagellar hook-basal body complex protein FliE [Kushneria sp. AK178]